jgi:hypothetical protein
MLVLKVRTSRPVCSFAAQLHRCDTASEHLHPKHLHSTPTLTHTQDVLVGRVRACRDRESRSCDKPSSGAHLHIWELADERLVRCVCVSDRISIPKNASSHSSAPILLVPHSMLGSELAVALLGSRSFLAEVAGLGQSTFCTIDNQLTSSSVHLRDTVIVGLGLHASIRYWTLDALESLS